MGLSTRATPPFLIVLTLLYLAAAAFLPFSQFILQHGSMSGKGDPSSAYPYPLWSSFLQVAVATVAIWIGTGVLYAVSGRPRSEDELAGHMAFTTSPPPFSIQSETELPPATRPSTLGAPGVSDPTRNWHPLFTVTMLMVPPALIFSVVIALSNVAIGSYSFILHLLSHPISIAVTALVTAACWGSGRGRDGRELGDHRRGWQCWR